MSGIIDRFAVQNPEIKIGKCNVEDYEDIAEIFGVRNLPCIVYLKNGELAGSRVGLQTVENIKELIEQDA